MSAPSSTEPRFAMRVRSALVTGLAAALALLGAMAHARAAFSGEWWRLSMLAFYGLLFALFVFRRPAWESVSRPRHWVLALGGTFLPFCIIPMARPAAGLIAFGIGLQVIAMAIALTSLFTLGRSFGIIAARRAVVSHGPYRFVRHPLYVGEALWLLAAVLQNPSTFNAAVLAVQCACQWRRIVDEEQVLLNDPQYAQYRSVVPYRLIPGVL
jgi:protein-S-isoprenylcysteine O-methyltransferase Ste14